MQARKRIEDNIENIGNLAKNNKVAELKELLDQQETKLNGHHFWNYHTDKNLVEGIARDAILEGREDIVKLLFEAGLSPDAHAYTDDNNRSIASLIHFAAKSGKLSMVKLLAEYGAKIYLTERDDRDKWNDDYGLRTAVKEGHADIVDYLLEYGAEANGLCGGGTLGEFHGGTTFLAKAADDGNIRIVESLVKHGAKIPSAITLAHEKMYVHGYRDYVNAIERNYSDKDRISKLEYAFHILYQNRSKFNVNYSLTPKAEAFFAELNVLLKDIDKLKNNENEKDNFLKLFINNLSNKFSIIVNDKDQLKRDLNDVLISLDEFDKKKNELQQKADELRNSYTRIVRTCMDYAIGCDFEAKSRGMFSGEYGGLSFLEDLDVSGMNFIGVSVAGEPVTRAVLEKETKLGAKQALVTTFDLMALDDEIRKNAINSRLNAAQIQRGSLVNQDGIVNLIPLNRAATIGDITAVKARIQAGEDPNLEKDGSSLTSAAKNGHTEIVKILFAAHAEHTANKTTRLIAEAREFVSHHPSVKSLSVAKGKVQSISIPFENDSCQMIVPGSKRFTSIMHMIRGFDQESLDSTTKVIALVSEAKNKNFIMVINHDGSTKYIQYGNQSDREELRKSITELIKLTSDEWNYFPVIFTNKNNFDAIETLIATQYQDIDKGKTAVIEAIEAARQKNYATIAAFLQDQQDVNLQDKDGNTLLHKAVSQGDLVRVRELIQKGADINLENKTGQTALSIATESSNSEWDPEKYAEMVKILLDNSADPNKYKWLSPLDLAVKAGNAEVVAMLLPVTIKKELIRKDYSSFEDKELRRDPWYVDMMFDAMHKKNGITILSLLKANGADFNVKSEHGGTLLNEAVYALPSFSHIKHTMEDLVRSGYGAAHMGDALKKTQEQLMEDSQKYFQEELKMLDFLFANGADPRIGGQDGQTPLALLIEKKDLSHLEKAADMVMDRFVKHGADVNAIDDHGLTPLHEAASTGDLIAIKYLLNHGAAINCQSKSKRTPLHCAAACGNQLSTKLLLERGADFTMTDEDGLTPLQLSEKAMANDKKIYTFNSIAAEREFESKYIAAQNAIKDFISQCEREGSKKRVLESVPITELVRQRSSLYNTTNSPDISTPMEQHEETNKSSMNMTNKRC